tara:strand:+ start:914 stop:1342 length:429 start_codon:yes stop_codon:yes gene_type:complete
MISMQTSLQFLFIVLLICGFFTLGRWTGWQEERTREYKKKPKPIVRKIENRPRQKPRKPRVDIESSLVNSVVIDAEYEDVVDLQKYIKKKERQKKRSVDETSEFSFIYSKKDGRLIRVPKEISDLLEEIKNIADDIDRDGSR